MSEPEFIVGLDNILDDVDRYTPENFPNFTIIEGYTGSGRKTVARYIANKMGYKYIEVEANMESLRDTIYAAFVLSVTNLYCITNWDASNYRVRDLLLKFAEEPPRFAKVVITTLPGEIAQTLISRAFRLFIPDYSHDVISTYMKEILGYPIPNPKIVAHARNISDIKKLQEINIEELEDFINKIFKNIAGASVGNSLKLKNELHIKESDKGIDLNMFISFIQDYAYTHPDDLRCRELFIRLNDYRKRISAVGVNKNMLADQIILTIKRTLGQ